MIEINVERNPINEKEHYLSDYVAFVVCSEDEECSLNLISSNGVMNCGEDKFIFFDRFETVEQYVKLCYNNPKWVRLYSDASQFNLKFKERLDLVHDTIFF